MVCGEICGISSAFDLLNNKLKNVIDETPKLCMTVLQNLFSDSLKNKVLKNLNGNALFYRIWMSYILMQCFIEIYQVRCGRWEKYCR